MHLYILRHADADTKAATDAERRLSEKGEQQAAQVGRFCASHRIMPDIILSSPVRRARETATIVADKLGLEICEVDWLACGAVPSEVIGHLGEYRKLSTVMLVGHEPDLGRLVAHLLGTKHGEVIQVRKAALIAMEVLAFREGGGQLDFSIPVKLM